MCPGHKICVRNKYCARGQTGKHLCPQQCVRNNVSLFARAFMFNSMHNVEMPSKMSYLLFISPPCQSRRITEWFLPESQNA